MHSALSCRFGGNYNTLTQEKRQLFQQVIFKDLQLIIIDEMSMVSANDIYDVHRRMQEIFPEVEEDALFGGKAIMFLGDLMQLKPVKGHPIFSKPGGRDGKRQALWGSTSNLWLNLKVITLTRNFRQEEDDQWMNCLNTVRCLTNIEDLPDDIRKLLESRRLTKKQEKIWTFVKDSFHAFYTNAEVEKHNNQKLSKLKGQLEKLKSKNHCSTKAYKFNIKEYGTIDDTNFMNELQLKKGAKVMLIFNVNTEDSLINGAMGKVIDFVKEAETEYVIAVIVQFDDPTVGLNLRRAKPELCSKYASENGTPIERIKLDYLPKGKSMTHSAVQCSVTQFPLRLSWASTAHKLQGVTIKANDHLVCNGHKRFPKGMGYVMLSRCSSIDSIHLANDFDLDKFLIADTESLKEKERLDKESIVPACQQETFDIFFLNVHSIIGSKMDSLQKDSKAMKSNYIALVETWIPEGDESFQIPGYNFHGVSNGRGKGCCIYAKESEQCQLLTTTSHENFQLMTIKITSKNLLMTVMYLSSGCNMNAVVAALRKVVPSGKKHIMIGDFNFDGKEENPLTEFLRKNKFEQQVERPTHEAGRCLDQVWINSTKLIREMNILGVYYSDHARITIKLDI